jgi:flagellar biosynthesis protein FlhA
MALIQCPECRTEISDKADICPKCGFPVSKQAETSGKGEAWKESLGATIPRFPVFLYFISIPIFLFLPFFTILPPFFLDVFLFFNLLFITIAMLWVARSPKWTAVQSLFFILAICRLLLNLNASYLILTRGNDGPDGAGKIIDAVGSLFTVFGSWPGLIVLLVIMVFHYIYHFGTITNMKKAFGSLHGFIAFARIDAIGGIFFLAVNLLGGFWQGMTKSDMPIFDVVKRYSLLTIGSAIAIQVTALIFYGALANKLKKLKVNDPASSGITNS